MPVDMSKMKKPEWRDFLDQAADLLSELDDMPPAGLAFAESVREKVESICETVRGNERVSEAQWSALENMRAGVERWHR